MMEKVLFAPLVLFSTLSAYAIHESIVELPQQPEKLGMMVYLGAHSASPIVSVDDLKQLVVYPNLGVQYSFKDNYSAGIGFSVDENKKIVSQLQFCVHYSEETFRPYAQVSYNAKYGDNKYSDYLDYAVGVQYRLNEDLMPYVKVSQFLNDPKRNVSIGAKVLFYEGLGLDISYNRNLLSKANSFEGNVIYQF